MEKHSKRILSSGLGMAEGAASSYNSIGISLKYLWALGPVSLAMSADKIWVLGPMVFNHSGLKHGNLCGNGDLEAFRLLGFKRFSDGI